MKRPYQLEPVRIGKHLGYMRRVKGITQEQLAEYLDVSVSWVSTLEQGKKLPNFKFVYRIAKVLQVPPRELLPL